MGGGVSKEVGKRIIADAALFVWWLVAFDRVALGPLE
jgi:hypothetical protein